MAKNRWINVKRYRQIIDVFAKNGFGLLMDQLGLFNYLKLRKKLFHAAGKPEHLKYSTGERLRMSFEELGPTFIKLGQIMSTRQDIFPSDIAEELKKLQDFVRPFPFAEVREVIESEFDDKLENIYKEFDEKPFAAASLSQVHHARLNSGKEAAVKVQRPGIEKIIDLDLHILKDLAHFMDNHTKYGQMYDFSTVAAEFENTMKNELDFTKEGENTDKFKENFLNDDGITVPEIKWIYTSSRVITMEYIEGIRVDDCESLEQAGIDRKLLARKLASSICNQILRDGFFHADPHPGNILILHDGTIVFIDCGMVGMLSESQKRIISDFS
jgi:ubiquinone biosynthesis protein